MKQRRVFSPVEAVKTVVIFVLIVLMLVLMVLLMIGQNGTREEELPQADRMVVYASGVQPMDTVGMDSARVSPYLLAYRRGGGKTQILHASDAAEKPYEALYPLLRELFGSRAVGYVPEQDAGAVLWTACADMTDYVYVDYNGALPASVIRAYTFSEEDSETFAAVLDERVQGSAAYIKELFFIPAQQLKPYDDILPMALTQDPDAVCALACDGDGEITLFCMAGSSVQPTKPVSADDSTENPGSAEPRAADVPAAQAAEAGALDAYIASIVALSSGAQTGALALFDAHGGTVVSLDGLYRMPQITLSRYVPENALYDDPRKLISVFGLLGMRENEIDNYYTDGGGDRIYLNASGRLTVSDSDAVIRYDALQEGGLALSDYLGYASIGGDYLLSEYLRAADRLLSLLEAEESAFCGDALTCTLIDVRIASDDAADTLVLTYGYTCRGIPLLDDSGAIRRAMVLQACGGLISHLELYPCHADAASAEQYLLPQSVALDAMLLEQQPSDGGDASDAVPYGLYMAYLCRETGGYGVFDAEWIGILP